MQYLRVVLVAVVAALVARLFGVSPSHGARRHRLVPAGRLAAARPRRWRSRSSARCSPAGCNIPAGAFLVPMVAGIVLTHFGLMTIELPTWLLAASYAFVGWNVGLRFTRPLLIHAADARCRASSAARWSLIVTVRRRRRR